MKNLFLTILFLNLLFGGNAYAETILLKCKFIEGKKDTYLANAIVKTTKWTAREEEIEMILNTALEKIIEAPYYYPYVTGGLEWETWQDDYIRWQGETNVALKYDTAFTYTLDRVKGILSMDQKHSIRIVKNGHYQKDANGKWVGDTEYQVKGTYQCKKEDRLF